MKSYPLALLGQSVGFGGGGLRADPPTPNPSLCPSAPLHLHTAPYVPPRPLPVASWINGFRTVLTSCSITWALARRQEEEEEEDHRNHTDSLDLTRPQDILMRNNKVCHSVSLPDGQEYSISDSRISTTRNYRRLPFLKNFYSDFLVVATTIIGDTSACSLHSVFFFPFLLVFGYFVM